MARRLVRTETGYKSLTKTNFPTLFPELDEHFLRWHFGYLRDLYLGLKRMSLSDNDRQALEAMLVGIIEVANEE